ALRSPTPNAAKYLFKLGFQSVDHACGANIQALPCQEHIRFARVRATFAKYWWHLMGTALVWSRTSHLFGHSSDFARPSASGICHQSMPRTKHAHADIRLGSIRLWPRHRITL